MVDDIIKQLNDFQDLQVFFVRHDPITSRLKSFIRVEPYEPEEFIHYELREGKFVRVEVSPF